jgi:transposase
VIVLLSSRSIVWMGNKGQVGYSSDVSDEEWAFVAPYLALCREDAAQRSHSLRAVFNALRWLVKTGAHWRMMPNDLPPWTVVYQQTRRWIGARCFEIMVVSPALSIVSALP